MRRRPTTAFFAALTVLLTACSGAAEDTAQQPTETATPVTETATPSPSPTPNETETATPAPTAEPTDDEARQRASCEHPEGITVEYPRDWHVNEGGTLPPCSAFDPQPLDVPDAQEFFDAGVLLSVEPVDFSTVADPESQTGRELNRRDELVDGHDAVRIETEAEGDAILEEGEGTRSTRWIVVLGREQTLTMTTHETGDAGEYESHREVLDEMVMRLELPENR